jgi:arabinose-5-phosphate isomerase
LKHEQRQPVEYGQEVLQAEGSAICTLAETVGTSRGFTEACEAIFGCQGLVVLTGVGKAGIIAQKISATLASTGTRSIFLHPVEALHGDLGRLERDDIVIALSNSGSSSEIVQLMDHIKRRGASLVAMTGQADSPLGTYAEITLCYGPLEEACPLGLAPTVTTSVMLALGDALALAVMRMRQFRPEDYAAFHPGGALGRKFLRVEEVMHSVGAKPMAIVSDQLTVREALVEGEEVGRRTGALLLANSAGTLTGILTDGDIRRLLVSHPSPDLMDQPVREVMTADPKHIHQAALASEAEAVLNQFHIDELPVVDDHGKPVGVLDVQDILGLKTLA